MLRVSVLLFESAETLPHCCLPARLRCLQWCLQRTVHFCLLSLVRQGTLGSYCWPLTVTCSTLGLVGGMRRFCCQSWMQEVGFIIRRPSGGSGRPTIELAEVFLACHVLDRICYCSNWVVVLVKLVLRRWLMRLNSTSIWSLPWGFRCANIGQVWWSEVLWWSRTPASGPVQPVSHLSS